MKKLNKKGFTLVELIVVIAIIGILAAVLVPSVTSYIGKAQKSAAQQNATNQYSSLVYALPECGGDINTFLNGVKISGKLADGSDLPVDTIKGYYVSSNGYTVLIIDGKTDVVLKGSGTKITDAKLTSAYTGTVEEGVKTSTLSVSAIYDEYDSKTNAKGVFIELPSVASKDDATNSCKVTYKLSA